MGAVSADLERVEDFHGLNFLPGLLAHLDKLSLTVTIRAVHLLDFKLGGLPDGEVDDIIERRVTGLLLELDVELFHHGGEFLKTRHAARHAVATGGVDLDHDTRAPMPVSIRFARFDSEGIGLTL
jgi:hypothetical protein